MHKIQEKEFTLEDFSCEHLIDTVSIEYLEDTIKRLNWCRDNYLEDPRKDLWWQMIQLLPSSYNQTRNVMMNYEVLANIYKSRKNHKLDEWREFCDWIENLPYSELICCDDALMTTNEQRKKIGLEPVEDYDFPMKPIPIKVKEDSDGHVVYGDTTAVTANCGRGDGLWQPGNEF